MKFSQCRLLGVIAFVSGLSFIPGFAFGESEDDIQAIDLVQNIADEHEIISNLDQNKKHCEFSTYSIEETETQEDCNPTNNGFWQIVDNYMGDTKSNISITIEKRSPKVVVANSTDSAVKASAIDLVQNIAKIPTEVPKVASESINNRKEAADTTNEMISPVAQNTPKADIEIKKEFPKEILSESAEDLEMPEFNSSDEPFSEEHPEYPPIEDPYEGYNRFMQGVNDGMYDYMIEPVATVYRDWIPEYFRLGIKNVFANAASPVRFVSSLLQGDLDKAARVIGRLVLNSTVGIGGLLDVAGDYYEVEPVNEDMEQVLGAYNIGSGPYLVLPFFGPSSPRNLVGQIFDAVLNPTFWFSPSFIVGAGITAEEKVNSTSFVVDDFKDLKENAVDPYVSLRDFNHQYREKLIRE